MQKTENSDYAGTILLLLKIVETTWSVILYLYLCQVLISDLPLCHILDLDLDLVS